MDFVHLHLHSKYSLRDSIIRPEELAIRLKDIGQNTVAVTDHGGQLGSVTIYKILKKEKIKYIHGCEMYICDDVSVKDKDSRYYHLVLLCKNEIGRLNLNKLISLSELPENKYYKPRIDFNILKQYSDGLICMSACMAGEISKLLELGEFEKAKQCALKYKTLFGEDYYLEVQAHNDEDQISQNKKIVSLAKDVGVNIVATCDAHYVYKEDKKYQNKYAFNGAYKEDGEAYVDCYVQSADEVAEKLSYLGEQVVKESIEETVKIANKCTLEIPLSAPIMPQLDTPKEFSDNKEWLEKICIDGFKQRLNIDYVNKCVSDPYSMLTRNIFDEDWNVVDKEYYQLTQSEIDEYINRYEYEMDALYRMGFIDYILLVYSYANVAKRRGIARGSGGGSLINYLSSITNIDPIEHNLYFERFIDVGALDLLEKGEITKKELKIPD